jgi:hypothetical protein
VPESLGHLMLPVLADAIAAIAEIARPAEPAANALCGLWVHDSIDELSTPTFSRLYIWGGEDADITPERIAVQCFTVGPNYPSAFARAAAIHKALLDTEGVPRIEWGVGPEVGQKYRISIFELSRPRAVGRDEKNRAEVSFDFEIGFVAV